jgi:hypothetical protein
VYFYRKDNRGWLVRLEEFGEVGRQNIVESTTGMGVMSKTNEGRWNEKSSTKRWS